MMMKSIYFSLAILGSALAPSGLAFAAGDHNSGHGHGGQERHGAHGSKAHNLTFGQAGDPSKVDRVVGIRMTDNAYSIRELKVKPGETIRFVLKNEGEFLHEFNIGFSTMHASHQKEMMAMMEGGAKSGMRHDDPNAVLVKPGETAELIWTFNRAGSLQFACNVPGHYESGMVGEIRFPAHN
jgi:uncharacterized cupredoxin-like copper-binding protein